MATETILQHWILANFILPFLLIFLIVFGILEKTKVFGDGNKQLNAFVSFVIGLIFVGAVSPKLVVGNLILFFTVSIVVLFIALLLWGFVSGDDAKLPDNPPLRIIVGILIVGAVTIALLFATGFESTAFDGLFKQPWSEAFWTNASFLAVIIVALVVIIKSKSSS
jgi:hypothetical protein